MLVLGEESLKRDDEGVERGRIRVTALGDIVPHLALALFTGADIRFELSERPPWKASHFERY